jgi:hypothetical protein
LVKAAESLAGISQPAVELAPEVIVHQSHSCIYITLVTRGTSEMLTEEHGIVPWTFRVENGIPVVAVQVSMREVELALNLAGIPVIA